MLDELHVRDLALIEEVRLEFGPGMTALTGETGTGKTALIGALKLLLGDRADSGSVRAGAAEMLVEGRFGSAGKEVVARRRVSADGRSRCQMDGEMVTVGSLAEAIGPLVDLHGQHEHQALLRVSSHVDYLDRWAGEAASDALEAYRAARAEHRDALRSRDRLAEQLSEAARNADYLRFVADEIGAVDPRPEEDAEIEARLPALQHAERLAEAAAQAASLLRGDDGATDKLALAAEVLTKVGGIDPALDTLSERLVEVLTLADDLGTELRGYRDGIDHDPVSLEALMARHAEINGLARKYGPRLADVLATRDEALAALAAFDAGEQGMRLAEEAVCGTEGAMRDAATTLVAVRLAAVPGFVDALGEAVVDLAMEGARFEVSFTELSFEQWAAEGPHRVEFLYAPAPGQPARPLAKIASGGEISRVMLALKGVLGEADTVETLVFDEIDSGVGGATAQAVGRRLATLAQRHQVIVVTHLAQVAACAGAQLVVRKSLEDGSAATSVQRVEGEVRVGEIARMLAGNDSETALAHARELLGETNRAVR